MTRTWTVASTKRLATLFLTGPCVEFGLRQLPVLPPVWFVWVPPTIATAAVTVGRLRWPGSRTRRLLRGWIEFYKGLRVIAPGLPLSDIRPHRMPAIEEDEDWVAGSGSPVGWIRRTRLFLDDLARRGSLGKCRNGSLRG